MSPALELARAAWPLLCGLACLAGLLGLLSVAAVMGSSTISQIEEQARVAATAVSSGAARREGRP